MTFGDHNASERKRRRAYGRAISGITRSISQGFGIVRRHKMSRLVSKTPCLCHIVLTSSPVSGKDMSYNFSKFVKRIRRVTTFEYFHMRTPEGVSGVIHVVAKMGRFIPKVCLSAVWSDLFQAPNVWITQLYGSKRSVLNYLMGYLKHHSAFTYGCSQNWIFKGFALRMKEIFRKYPFKTALAVWDNILQSNEVNLKNDTLSL